MVGEDSAPGWSAIDAALERLYGDAVPLHVAPELPSYLGGVEALDGISIYAREDPVPHWHLISYGMSELYEKRSENPVDSGFGFEFTLRAARRPAGDAPPAWAVLLIQQLSAYVLATGEWFTPGQTLRPGRLTLGDLDTRLTALGFIVDSELGTIPTPFGGLAFLQIVALSDAEYAAAQDGNARVVLDAIGEKVPLHVIDPARPSLW
ncbi:suppressor of fused domain protein [Hamadaea sp. NPDC050747]|uniref:suppressor of fused domain protein n=1 Tax=Hamadaea sp. NPDC050747 TaxID=3155789 RepID=UPI00340FC87E